MLYVFPTGLYRYNLFAEQLSLDASHTTLKKPVRSSPQAYTVIPRIDQLLKTSSILILKSPSHQSRERKN